MFGKSAKRKKRAEQLRSLIEAGGRWSDDPSAFEPQQGLSWGYGVEFIVPDGNPENTFVNDCAYVLTPTGIIYVWDPPNNSFSLQLRFAEMEDVDIGAAGDGRVTAMMLTRGATGPTDMRPFGFVESYVWRHVRRGSGSIRRASNQSPERHLVAQSAFGGARGHRLCGTGP